MRKFVFMLLAALAPAAVLAQNIALGERVPEPKVQHWLAGRERAPASLTYVEFFHSASRNSMESVRHLERLSEELGDRMRVIILVHEPEAKVAPLLRPCLSEHIGVGFDPGGKLFSAYNVAYVPFGVLLGPRSRARWMGNTLQLTLDIIEQSTK
ncbi:MAG: hypothetical protein K2O55_04900 [Alistipes sp.]|nr:hypothetical protein [Alistipes sp.]